MIVACLTSTLLPGLPLICNVFREGEHITVHKVECNILGNED